MTGPPPPSDAPEELRAGVPSSMLRLVSGLLLVGSGVGAAVLTVGILLLLHQGAGGLLTGPVRLPYHSLLGDLAHGQPYALLWTGHLVLELTPLARVIASVVFFVRARDRAFVALTMFVLLVLIGSVGMGLTV